MGIVDLVPPGSLAPTRVRLLVVEDSLDDMELVATALRAAGVEAETRRVDTTGELRAALAEGGWDAIISDYHVPGIGSGGALPVLLESGYAGPIIVVSSVIGEENAVAQLKAGAHDFVMKTRLERLGPVLKRELAEAALRREHARAQRALADSEQQLRELTASMQGVREQEQARIARELHDELGQVLTALKFEVSWIGARLEPGQDAIKRKLDGMRATIAGAIEDVRRIAGDLRPAVLDELGLAAAIEWQLKKFREFTDTAVELEVSHEEFAIEETVAVAAFRVVQEGLTNAARHAHAARVSVRARHGGDRLTLEIADDGDGIAAREPGRAGGLVGMRERVQQLGGTLLIESAPGRGTRLFASIPCTLAEPGRAAS
jgi:signal transduction histidine kinase